MDLSGNDTDNRTSLAVRALGLVALTSIAAPALGCILLFGFAALLPLSHWVGLYDLFGLTLWAVILGFVPTVACCLVALGGTWPALRRDAASRVGFAGAGAVLALGEWTAITADAIDDWSLDTLTGSANIIAVLVVTGATFGLIWWSVLGRRAGLRPSAEQHRAGGKEQLVE